MGGEGEAERGGAAPAGAAQREALKCTMAGRRAPDEAKRLDEREEVAEGGLDEDLNVASAEELQGDGDEQARRRDIEKEGRRPTGEGSHGAPAAGKVG